jgi:hypothetical protein
MKQVGCFLLDTSGSFSAICQLLEADCRLSVSHCQLLEAGGQLYVSHIRQDDGYLSVT